MDLLRASGFCVPYIQHLTVAGCTLHNSAISSTKADFGAFAAFGGRAS
nr:MAG TPA: hypothetical protein [Caudoviricetes sp.]